MKRVAQPAAGVTIALIYTRVSKDDQREGLSLDFQLAHCRRYAADKGWMLGREYQDVMTAKRDDRRAYQALLAEVRRLRAEGHSVAVIVLRLDRFGRRVLERVRCREELKALGVPTHSIREGGEVSDLVANILASVAEEESRRLGERVLDYRDHVTDRGWQPIGRPPWGYRWRDATAEERASGAPKKVLELDPDEAPYVQEAWRRVADGATVRSVAAWVAGLPAAARGGRTLTFKAVRSVFNAAVYVARHQQGDAPILDRPQGRWPALVDDDTWGRAHAQIASHDTLPKQASGEFLLTGRLRCHKCGGRMVGHHPRRRVPSYRYYRCNGFAKGSGAPDPKCTTYVSTVQVETAVLGDVEAILGAAGSPALEAAIRREWERVRQPSDHDDRRRRIQHLEQTAEQARRRITRGTEMYVDGNLDRAAYEALCEKARADLDSAAAELARLRGHQPAPTLPPIDDVLRDAGGWSEILRGADVPAQRAVLAELIETVAPIKVAYGRYTARITWTPLGEALRELAARLRAAA